MAGALQVDTCFQDGFEPDGQAPPCGSWPAAAEPQVRLVLLKTILPVVSVDTNGGSTLERLGDRTKSRAWSVSGPVPEGRVAAVIRMDDGRRLSRTANLTIGADILESYGHPF